MKINCSLCGNQIELPVAVAEGQHVLCPYCGQKFSYMSDAHAFDQGGGGKRSLAKKETSENRHTSPAGTADGKIKFCRNCGTALSTNAAVCAKCGAAITFAPRLTQNTKSNEWQTATILCLFFGAIGVHRFYLKDMNMALLQLILGLVSCFIISGVWGLIDLILLLSGNFKTGDGRLVTYA